MIWMIGGYLWLYLHRPFEFWTWLGDLRIERVFMLITLLVWVFYPGKGWAANRLNKALLFFTIAILGCWMNSPYASDLGEKVFEEHCKVGVLFLIIITTIDTEEKLKRLLFFYFLGLFLFQAHSFLEFLNGRHEFRQGIMRMNAVNKTHGDPNTFSATLLHALPYLIPFWLTARVARVKPLVVLYIGLSLLCIYLTGSRRAYVGIAFISFLLMLRSKRRWSLLAMSALLVPIVFGVMRSDLQDRLMSLVSTETANVHATSSARFRLQALFYGFDIWSNNLITGTGPSTFALASKTGLQAHNLYAQTMSEMGLLGVISLLAMSICFFLNVRDIKRIYREHPWWEQDFVYHVGTLGTSCAIILLLFMGTAGHNLFRYNWLWFAAFQMCALHVVKRRAAMEANHYWQADQESQRFNGYTYATA